MELGPHVPLKLAELTATPGNAFQARSAADGAGRRGAGSPGKPARAHLG